MPLLVLALMCGAFLCGAAEAGTPSPAEKQRTVKVGYYPFDGFLMKDAGNGRSGYGYDYLQELRNSNNWKYEYSDNFLASNDWSQMLEQLKAGRIDLVPGVSKTPEREKDFAFSKYPLAKVSTLLTVKAGNIRFRSGDYANWGKIRVGLLKNASQQEDFKEFAAKNNLEYQLVEFERPEELIDALLTQGSIDAAVTSSLRQIRSGEWVCAQFNVSHMYIVVRKNDTALLAELDRAMERIESLLPDFQESLRRTYYTHKESGILSFSEEERGLIENAQKTERVFNCILNPDRKPFSWVENGEIRGIFKDYADEIARRTGLKFHFIPVKNRAEYYARRFSPEVDIVFDMLLDRQQAEIHGIRLSQPYFSVSVSMLRDKNAGNSIRTVAVLKDSELEQLVRANLSPDTAIRSFDSVDELVEAVGGRDCDAAYLYTRTAEYAVSQSDHNQLVINYIPFMETTFALGVKNALDPRLLSVLNKAVLSLDDAFVNRTRVDYAPRFRETFSLNMFIHRHPFWAVAIPVALLLLICGIFLYILYRRKKTYRTGILFSNLPLRCFVINGHGKFLYCALGQRSSLFRAPRLRGIDDIPEEETRAVMRAKVAEVLKTGSTCMVEFSFDGNSRSAIVSRLPDSAFGMNTVLWISQDISELQANRDETRKHEDFFRLTLESIGDGAITTDAAGNVLLLNPVAERLTGMTCAEAKGKPHEEVFRIVNAGDGKTVASPLRKALDAGKIVELGNHTDLLSHDGSRYHVADCAGPIRDRKGAIIGAVLIFRDVTQEYRRREELRNSIANWETAADVAQLYPYKVNIRTREALGDFTRLNHFWPVVDGKAVPMEEWIVPEDQPMVSRVYEEFKAGKKPEYIVSYRAGKGADVRHFRWFGRLDENDPEIMSGLIQDITELVEASETLRETNLMWKNVMDELPVLFFVKDANNDCRYLMCNKANAEFLGLPAEKVLGRTSQEISKPGAAFDIYLETERRILADHSIPYPGQYPGCGRNRA